MENLDLKFNYLIGKLGKYNLAKKLEIGYLKLVRLINNPDSITIGMLNKIDKLYNDSINE
jgi:plasmid maintenance system antidote protein VapI